MPFFIIFVLIPLTEVLIFMAVGESIGIFKALLFALMTAVIGGFIVQYQGLNTITHIKAALDRGRLPLNEFFDGICLIAAGATLITPGFLTDFIGFVLLIPFMRSLIRRLIQKHTSWGIDDMQGPGDMGSHSRKTPPPGDIIEGDYERVDDKPNRS